MLARVAVSIASLALGACSSAPGEDVATSAEEALSARHVGRVTTISYAPNSFAIGKLLKWRYVLRDGRWVLVRDPAPPADAPNWYFVHRGCVSVANLR